MVVRNRVLLRRLSAATLLLPSCRGLVSLHGHAHLSTRSRMKGQQQQVHDNVRPPDPKKLLSSSEQEVIVEQLVNWWSDKKSVLCLTGAGLSTESGIPDYRGYNGSYHRGHKPMVHDQFMKSEYQRKRYWGRGMVGWKSFDETAPNEGHYALADLEAAGKLGVLFEDRVDFYDDDSDDYYFGTGQRQLALITQNVDSLHRRAGTSQMIELHGRTDRLKCMQCGSFRDRRSFHAELEALNEEWLAMALAQADTNEMRPDGDAFVKTDTYDQVRIPPCTHCGGFLKPDVVFFGDTVPKGRVAQCRAAVDSADGILVVGSSLAVHSAFRHIRQAHQKGVPIAILNVGPTRAETEGLDVLKLEAPAGPTLTAVSNYFCGERLDTVAAET